MKESCLEDGSVAEREQKSVDTALRGVKRALSVVVFVQATFKEGTRLEEEDKTAVPQINHMGVSGHEAYTSLGQLLDYDKGSVGWSRSRKRVNLIRTKFPQKNKRYANDEAFLVLYVSILHDSIGFC